MQVELRSDTFTQPTQPMLEAMMRAPTGDDVFGEDPTINALEATIADMFGMEAAIFCPSGTMTNQIGIKAHTQPGDEVICDEMSHVYQYEGGGIAFNAGCSVRLLQGHRGRLTAAMVEAAINPDDPHKAASRLVVLENTTNRGGGACYDFDDILAIKAVCRQHGLAFHLDGARLWNALVAKTETTRDYGAAFDSISVCLSKGLGTPVGSVLAGTHECIKKARRIRKVFGGGMRQAGILAAAGLYALEHHVTRLQQDHHHAAQAAAALTQLPWVKEVLPAETNIVIFYLHDHVPAKNIVEALKREGVRCLATGPHAIRWVFHLDVSPEATQYAIQVIHGLKIDF